MANKQAVAGHLLSTPKPVFFTLAGGDGTVQSIGGGGDLYFIGGDTGPVKIGFSCNPKTRLRQLQHAHAETLHILAVIPGGEQLEREYHQRFAAARLRGEWFERTPETKAEIARLSPPSVCGMGVAACAT